MTAAFVARLTHCWVWLMLSWFSSIRNRLPRQHAVAGMRKGKSRWLELFIRCLTQADIHEALHLIDLMTSLQSDPWMFPAELGTQKARAQGGMPASTVELVAEMMGPTCWCHVLPS